MSGGSHRLQIDRDVFVYDVFACDEGSFVALSEDFYGRSIVFVEALCACSRVDSRLYWKENCVDVP